MQPEPSKPLVVALAGGSSSGKTTVVERIIQRLPARAMALLDLDSYYKDLRDRPLPERARFNFDHPDAFDVPLLLDHVQRLLRGEAVPKPVYSYLEHCREEHVQMVEPAEVIILEGIMALALEPIRRLAQIKIFVETDDDIRLIRRLVRDIRERGRTFEGVLDQYQESVRPMHLTFVEPSKRHADIIIPRGGHNEVAIGMVVETIRARLAQADRS